jgi:hypothetical protein
MFDKIKWKRLVIRNLFCKKTKVRKKEKSQKEYVEKKRQENYNKFA